MTAIDQHQDNVSGLARSNASKVTRAAGTCTTLGDVHAGGSDVSSKGDDSLLGGDDRNADEEL